MKGNTFYRSGDVVYILANNSFFAKGRIGSVLSYDDKIWHSAAVLVPYTYGEYRYHPNAITLVMRKIV